MSAKSWAIVVLVVIALLVVGGIAIAAKLDFVGIGVVVVGCGAAAYFAGRLDKHDDDAESGSTPGVERH